MSKNVKGKKRTTVKQARENNMKEFMEQGPGMRTTTKTWVESVDLEKGTCVIGGLGCMGVGEMTEPISPRTHKRRGYTDALRKYLKEKEEQESAVKPPLHIGVIEPSLGGRLTAACKHVKTIEGMAETLRHWYKDAEHTKRKVWGEVLALLKVNPKYHDIFGDDAPSTLHHDPNTNRVFIIFKTKTDELPEDFLIRS